MSFLLRPLGPSESVESLRAEQTLEASPSPSPSPKGSRSCLRPWSWARGQSRGRLILRNAAADEEVAWSGRYIVLEYHLKYDGPRV
ncbi:uncharacterized protein FTOL_04340 [Fusarium torulosum]|uniref:Uncharacterized protein n=1 Tax=Fusarium torulosum TaxID=33205 RepID=A0AAE8SGN4_9HYPO|nr:uncharacterized protein FTOL_04340 [Fusarium torulosum]